MTIKKDHLRAFRSGSLGLFAFLSLALPCVASAQTFGSTDKVMILNVAGSVSRLFETSSPNSPVFVNPPNSTQQRQLWKFTPEQVMVFQGGRFQSRSVFKIASVTDAGDVLSVPPNQYGDGTVVIEQKDDPNIHNLRPANRWELVRVPNLPFFQLRNGWNSSVCLMNPQQTYQLLFLASCNAGDSRQWYSLITDRGVIK